MNYVETELKLFARMLARSKLKPRFLVGDFVYVERNVNDKGFGRVFRVKQQRRKDIRALTDITYDVHNAAPLRRSAVFASWRDEYTTTSALYDAADVFVAWQTHYGPVANCYRNGFIPKDKNR